MTVTVDRRNPDPRHSHAWRWGRATQLCRAQGQPDFSDDPIVCEVWNYVCAMASAQTQKQISAVRQRWPLLAAAHGIYRDADVLREQIEERLVAGEDADQVAIATGNQ